LEEVKKVKEGDLLTTQEPFDFWRFGESNGESEWR